MAPGDPFGELATNPNIPPEVRLALRAKFGLDDPIWSRYLHWLFAMLHGDWGFSFVSRMNVDTLILQRLPTTLIVIGSSQLLAILVALPVGVLAATRPYSLFDQIANTLAFIGFSLPTFFTGLLLILVFSVQLDWLLTSAMLASDTPVVMAVPLVFAPLVVLCTLIADTIYGGLAPRIAFR